MVFGLKNTPSTFQRVIKVIFSTVRWRFALVYLDYIIMFSNTPEEHLTHLRYVWTLFSEAGVTLKLKKCLLFTDRIDYLGHVI